jgi:hypothetical protein
MLNGFAVQGLHEAVLVFPLKNNIAIAGFGNKLLLHSLILTNPIFSVSL